MSLRVTEPTTRAVTRIFPTTAGRLGMAFPVAIPPAVAMIGGAPTFARSLGVPLGVTKPTAAAAAALTATFRTRATPRPFVVVTLILGTTLGAAGPIVVVFFVA